MDQYTQVSYELARRLTLRYSSSFGLASRLYAPAVRPHIYAIYGMVRVADEIVDTYDGPDRAEQLEAFKVEIASAVASGYSNNPIVQAFAATARRFGITSGLTDPFFDSMRTDLSQKAFTKPEYDAYVYGSAEVIGLMCLRVFCSADEYDALAPGARRLGSAYQKVNFLRDFMADYAERGRVYFPGVTFDGFTDQVKAGLVADLTSDFTAARDDIRRLPRSARRAVLASYYYYAALLHRLQRMSATQVTQRRAHVPAIYKAWIFIALTLGLLR